MNTAYDEILEESAGESRSREREAMRASIEAMEEADRNPGDPAARANAIFLTSRLWSALLEDLASADNGYPDELKAQIISIGIFVLRQCEALRSDTEKDFAAIAEISRILEEGLV